MVYSDKRAKRLILMFTGIGILALVMVATRVLAR